MTELGLAGVDAAPDFGLVAPAGLPAGIVERLGSAAQAVVNADAMRTRLREIGYEGVGSTPQAFADHIDTAIEKWRRIIVAGKIKPE
jgi:tripartite-type tricarboxylate transporter receptor subunit TctC